MDLSGAIREIRAGGERHPLVMTVGGREYAFLPTANNMYDIVRDPRPVADRRAEAHTLHLSTLAGLVDFINANIDGIQLDDCLVAVRGPLEVSLVSKLVPSHLGDHPTAMERDCFVSVQADDCGWKFGVRVTQEDFVLGLLLNFVPSPERQDLLNLVGNVRSEVVSSGMDDGVTQVVEGRAGVRLNAAIPVRNPWMLRPYRAFREVEQVESPFVMRAHRSAEGELPLFSLHEADGASWTFEAIGRVASWLKEKLGDKIHVLA